MLAAQDALGSPVAALMGQRGPLVRGTLLQLLRPPAACPGAAAPVHARVALPAAARLIGSAGGGEPGAAAACAAEAALLPCAAVRRVREEGAGAAEGGAGAASAGGVGTWAAFRWASGRMVGGEPRPPPARGGEPARGAGAAASRFASAAGGAAGAWAAARGGLWGAHTAREALGCAGGRAAVLVTCRLEHADLTALAHLSGCAALAGCLAARDPVAAVASLWLARPRPPRVEVVRHVWSQRVARAHASVMGHCWHIWRVEMLEGTDIHVMQGQALCTSEEKGRRARTPGRHRHIRNPQAALPCRPGEQLRQASSGTAPRLRLARWRAAAAAGAWPCSWARRARPAPPWSRACWRRCRAWRPGGRPSGARRRRRTQTLHPTCSL